MPLGSFAGVTYDEIELELQPNDLLVFCTDGIFESSDERGVGVRRARARARSWRGTATIRPA